MDYAYIIDKARIKCPDKPVHKHRYDSLCDYAVCTWRIRSQGKDVYIGESKLATSARTAKEYMQGSIHGNSNFPDKERQQSLVYGIYRWIALFHDKETAWKRRCCAETYARKGIGKRKDTRLYREINKWIDTLNDTQILKLCAAFDNVSKRHND